MVIETKFDIGNKAYYLNTNNDISFGEIDRIETLHYDGGLHIAYTINNTKRYEDEVFESKEDAIEYWINKQNV